MIAFFLAELLCAMRKRSPSASVPKRLAYQCFGRAGMNVASRIRMMPNAFRLQGLIGTICVIVACADGSSAAPEQAANAACMPAGGPKALAELPEASGLALSRRTPGLLWSHNDSGEPVLFAFEASGTLRGRVRVANATVDDWEDVTAARCPAGNCLYIADIGDNNMSRPRITIYRIPEPQPQDKESAPAETFTARYPDGTHDAEALFVAGDDVFVITKDAAATMYRFPRPLRSGAEMTLERAGGLPLKQVTDAEVSTDGTWVAVRTNDEVALYRTADLVRGGSPQPVMVPLRELKEPQGEGVALDANGTLHLTSEAGGRTRAGSLVTLRCTLP
jgi:hypothetical protein